MTRLLKIIFVLAIGALLASCRITVKIKESKTIEEDFKLNKKDFEHFKVCDVVYLEEVQDDTKI